VLLVLVSVLVGAKVLSGADTSQQVWAASRGLAAGTVLAEDDLQLAKVRLFGTSSHYVAGPPPLGYVVLRGVSAGELLPGDALSQPGRDVPRRDISVPVALGHLPPDLARGEQVDVYVTPDDKAVRRATSAKGGDPYAPRLVLRAVTVARVERSGGLGSSGQDQPVVLSVDPAQVLTLVQALAEGRIDLVRIPRTQQTALVPASEAP